MNNVERTKTVYFELYSKELGHKEIEEPKGWNEDYLSFQKDKESKDIRKEIEIDLEFYGEGGNYLRTLYVGHGVFPNCIITKYEKSTTGLEETWNLAYIQRLDLLTIDTRKSDGRVTIKAYEGGLFELIKNRYDDDVDLIGEYSLDGEYIGPLKTHKFQANERKIFLQSLLEGKFDRYRIGTGYWDYQLPVYSSRPMPMNIAHKSDGSEDIQQPRMVDEYFNTGRSQHASIGFDIDSEVGSDVPFFFEAEENKLLRIKLTGTFQVTEFERRHEEGTSVIYARIIKSYKGEDGIQRLKEDNTIIYKPIIANIRSIIPVEWEGEIHLAKGESLSAIFTTRVAIDSRPAFENGYANTWINSDLSMVIQDITEYPPVPSIAVKPLDLFDRLVAKITGKTGLVRSEIFGPDGEFEFKVVDNGFLARRFPIEGYKDENGEDLMIQFNTSFKKAFEAFSAITPMAWFSQKEGNREILRVEPETHTLSNFVGISFDSVDDINEECSKNDQFSKIELGHDGSLEYEEVNGLDEPNGKASFATYLGASVNQTYSKISPYRFDPMGYELIRRLPHDRFPYQDTERDEDIWIHDGKLQGDTIVHRHWSDDFAEAPRGIFHPESMWNLRHSPMNLLLNGHGYSVRRCLYHNTNRRIRFAGSNANQNLVTFPKVGFKLEEKGEIVTHRLAKQRIKADKVTMTVQITPEIRKQLEGVNENGIKNAFGLIEYPEDGIKKYGRIIKLSSGESSKLELIKAGI